MARALTTSEANKHLLEHGFGSNTYFLADNKWQINSVHIIECEKTGLSYLRFSKVENRRDAIGYRYQDFKASEKKEIIDFLVNVASKHIVDFSEIK